MPRALHSPRLWALGAGERQAGRGAPWVLILVELFTLVSLTGHFSCCNVRASMYLTPTSPSGHSMNVRFSVPNLQCGLGAGQACGKSEILGRNWGSPGGPPSLPPPLSQQGLRQTYFGVNEPVTPPAPSFRAETSCLGLSSGELGPTCQRTGALGFTACVCVLAWLSLCALGCPVCGSYACMFVYVGVGRQVSLNTRLQYVSLCALIRVSIREHLRKLFPLAAAVLKSVSGG